MFWLCSIQVLGPIWRGLRSRPSFAMLAKSSFVVVTLIEVLSSMRKVTCRCWGSSSPAVAAQTRHPVFICGQGLTSASQRWNAVDQVRFVFSSSGLNSGVFEAARGREAVGSLWPACWVLPVLRPAGCLTRSGHLDLVGMWLMLSGEFRRRGSGRRYLLAV